MTNEKKELLETLKELITLTGLTCLVYFLQDEERPEREEPSQRSEYDEGYEEGFHGAMVDDALNDKYMMAQLGAEGYLKWKREVIDLILKDENT